MEEEIEIKVGDKVYCKVDWHYLNYKFIVGRIYTIERVFDDDSYVVNGILFPRYPYMYRQGSFKKDAAGFNYYFIPIKKLRKDKLNKLNNISKLKKYQTI